MSDNTATMATAQPVEITGECDFCDKPATHVRGEEAEYPCTAEDLLCDRCWEHRHDCPTCEDGKVSVTGNLCAKCEEE